MSLPRSNSSYFNAWAKINKYFTFPIYHTNDVAEEWKDVSCDLQRWAMSMLKGSGIDTEIYGMKSSMIDLMNSIEWWRSVPSLAHWRHAECWKLKRFLCHELLYLECGIIHENYEFFVLVYYDFPDNRRKKIAPFERLHDIYTFVFLPKYLFTQRKMCSVGNHCACLHNLRVYANAKCC